MSNYTVRTMSVTFGDVGPNEMARERQILYETKGEVDILRKKLLFWGIIFSRNWITTFRNSLFIMLIGKLFYGRTNSNHVIIFLLGLPATICYWHDHRLRTVELELSFHCNNCHLVAMNAMLSMSSPIWYLCGIFRIIFRIIISLELTIT